jgi:hypothetical protein
MYKNNSGFNAKSKVIKYKKESVFNRNLVRFNPLLFLYKPLEII